MGDQFGPYSKVFGYSKEEVMMIIKEMAETGQEPTSSMSNDTPLAVFSDNQNGFIVISDNYLPRLPIRQSIQYGKAW